MKNKENVIVLIGLVVVILFWFVISLINDIKRERRLVDDGKYAIGKVENFYDDLHASPSVMYRFVYKDKSYKDFSDIEFIDKTLIGKRFYVLFLGDYPSTSKILLDKAVPDKIQQAPYEGWVELPN